MKIESVKIEDLICPDYNPREISDNEMEKLKKSINKFGYVDPIIVNSYNYHIIGGNQRFEAMKQLGYDEVEVSFVHITDPNQEKALNIALNKISGDWNEEKLSTILSEIALSDFDITLTGFDDIELEEYEIVNESEEIIEDEYDEEDEIEVNVEKGDLFQLGNHFLLCGDATNKNDLQKLLSKNNSSDLTFIDCYITDPPYGVDYSGKNEFLNKYDKGNNVQKEIVNDNIEDYESFFTKILNNVKPFLNDYNLFFVFMSSQELHNFRIAINNAGYKWSDYLIWVKNGHVLGRKDYHLKHEFCVYGWYNHHKFYGGFQTTVLEFDKPLKSNLHPTMKPVSLIGKLLKDGTKKNMNVLDTFGGSGSTLIACEELERNCFMIEFEPYYCQVIINRWEDFTGLKAKKL